MTHGRAVPSRRVFFAFWPDEAQRSAIEHAAGKAVRHSGGRPVPAANLHVTLAFLGNVLAARIPELQRIARERSAAFTGQIPATLTFARLAHWQEAQVLCALATEERPAAGALAAALQEATSTAGFSPDRKPFQAHVTLARKVIRPGTSLRLRPVVWRFESFALIDSRTQPSGAVYSVIETYPLASGEKARD